MAQPHMRPVSRASSLFTGNRASALGIDFQHDAGASGDWRLPEIMGGGVALFDADGDGRLDLYLVDGGAAERGRTGGNRLFVQQDDGRFEDQSARSGLRDTGLGMGVAIGDFDGDGLLDVYVTNVGPDQLYRNLGDRRFENVTRRARATVDGWSSSAAFVDVDSDGDLDLFVTRYVAFDPSITCTDDAGRRDYCGPHSYLPVSDVLLVNRGDGTFRDGSARAGIAGRAAAGLGLVCEDFDDDGDTDVFVTNDGDANHLWINRGDGTFAEEAALRGAAYNMHGAAEAGMGVVADDLDGDGLVDLFVTHLANESNTWYRNVGAGDGFIDATGGSGLGGTSMPRTGFGTAALDVDADGDLDLLVANGRVSRAARAVAGALPWSWYGEHDQIFLNDDGRFDAAPPAAGGVRAVPAVSRGLAVGDIDADGRPDVVITVIDGTPRVHLGAIDAVPRCTVVPVDGQHGLPVAGARVTLRTDGPSMMRAVRRASSYLSSSEPAAFFAAPGASMIESIDVRWPDGVSERFGARALPGRHVVRRGAGEAIR